MLAQAEHVRLIGREALTPDLKRLEFLRRSLRLLYRFHLRHRRATVKPLHHFLHQRALPLYHCLYSAIWQIAHPADQPQRRRLLSGTVAIADALHAA